MAGNAIYWFIASMVIQQVQASNARAAQKRQQEEADAKADAQRGFQLVTSGEPAAIPVAYGRNKLGGSRVYHATFSNYTADSTILAAVRAAGGKVLLSNNPVVLVMPESGKVRHYFTGPPGLNLLQAQNTLGYDSSPVLESVPVNGGSQNGQVNNNYTNGAADAAAAGLANQAKESVSGDPPAGLSTGNNTTDGNA